MRQMALRGAGRGRSCRTTIADDVAARPGDRVNRQFTATRPNALWVADLSYVATWRGFVYVTFIIDAYARRIVGWRVANSLRTDLVLDALEQALCTRQHPGTCSSPRYCRSAIRSAWQRPVLHRRSAVSATPTTMPWPRQSLACTRPKSSGDVARGDTSTPSNSTLEWVDWFNNRRLLEPIGNLPPAEFEQAYYELQTQAVAARVN